MITIASKSQGSFCDGISRRDFLQIGSLALGGACLPQILRAQSLSQSTVSSSKSVIMIYLPGGPSHQDMFDLKPNAPSEVRGEFKPISTNVNGIEISEHLPLLAKRMDRCTIIRSISDCEEKHDAFQCLTGRSSKNQPSGGWPSFGSTVSCVQGAKEASVPPFIGLSPKMGHAPWSSNGAPGYLGIKYGPFEPNKGGSASDMTLDGITLERLTDRKGLLTSFDKFRREADNTGSMNGIDAFNKQAFGVLTSSKLLEALDITKENQRVLDQYGKGDSKNRDDGGQKLMTHFLAARRLVEAGARVVTVSFSRWDHHGKNFEALRQDLPLLDQGLTALLDDLKQRGLEKDVAVVVWGEFGRTPIINKDGGRDHWPRVSCALMSGGNMRHGQVIGVTDKIAGEAIERPVKFSEVFATLYQHMGINTMDQTLNDLSGRPQYLVEPGIAPIKELIIS
jgi:hypothetical protein